MKLMLSAGKFSWNTQFLEATQARKIRIDLKVSVDEDESSMYLIHPCGNISLLPQNQDHVFHGRYLQFHNLLPTAL